MKQKTAMTDLLEAIEFFKEVVNKEGEPYFNMVKAVAENLKATTEREQIEEAYKQGCQDTYGNDEPSSSDPEDEKSASDYYQQKYGDEKNTQP
jgi:hypothetical protein